MCPDTQNLRGSIKQDIRSLINSSVLPVLGTGLGYGACRCGGPGWRRAAYLNMSDPTQTCPPAWELITTPRRSCARPSSASSQTCYSAMFPTQNIQYTLRSVEESLDIKLDNLKHLVLAEGALLTNDMLME